MADSPLPLELHRVLKPRLSKMLAVLRRFVTTESPSLEKTAADRCCSVIAKERRRGDAQVERIPQKHRGDHLRLTYPPREFRPTSQLLVLAHHDTVCSTETVREMTHRFPGGQASGRGHIP